MDSKVDVGMAGIMESKLTARPTCVFFKGGINKDTLHRGEPRHPEEIICRGRSRQRARPNGRSDLFLVSSWNSGYWLVSGQFGLASLVTVQ